LLLACLVPAAACRSTSAEEKAAGSGADPAVSALALAAPAPSASPADGASLGVYEVSGAAQPFRTSRLSAKGSGILRSIRVREGDRVKAGQLLCQLDTTDIQIRAQSAAVAHAQALEALRNARSDLDRAGALFDAGVLPDQTIEKAHLAVRIADLQVQAAKVGMRMTQQALADASLLAPFGGVVTKVLAEEGQMITQMPPVIIFILADTDTLEVKVPIPERKLARVKVGAPVVVSLPAVGVERAAKVDRIAEVVDPMTRSTEAVIRLDNRDRALAAGLFAKVRFPGVLADPREEPSAPASSAGVVAAPPPAPTTPTPAPAGHGR
jgi:RND family efflux transporter MFP subunit